MLFGPVRALTSGLGHVVPSEENDMNHHAEALASLERAKILVWQALNPMIPIPHPISHNVALTLDETLRSIEDALSEMRPREV